MSTDNGTQRQLQIRRNTSLGNRKAKTIFLDSSANYLALICLWVINLNSVVASAQSIQENKQTLQVQPSIQFSTELEVEDGSSTPAFFNLLSFIGQEKQWQDAQVEIKLPVQEEDLLLAKYLKQLSASNSAQASEATSVRSMLPKLDYHTVGRLEAVNDLDPPIWVVWLPQETTQISKSDFKALEQVLNVLRDYAEPESIVYVYQGQLMPKSSGVSFRVANFNLDKLKKLKRSAQTKRSQSSQFSSEGFGELLKAIQFQYNSPSDQVLSNSSYKCGRACREMMPTLRIIALNHGELELNPQVSPRFKELFESTRYPEHFLYRPLLTIVNTAQAELQQTKFSYPWLEDFTLPSFDKTILNLDLELVERVKLIRSRASSTYYLSSPLSIPLYFWGKNQIEISTRVSQGEQTVVQSAYLKFPRHNFGEFDKKRVQKYKTYQSFLDSVRKQFIKPAKLPFITTIFIGFIWVAVSLAILAFIIIRLRKNRSHVDLPRVAAHEELPSRSDHAEPKSDLIIEPPANSVQPISRAPEAQVLTPDDYARQKRQERERSLPRKKPSQLSPMVNPEDPSTMPAPVAEAKVSDQPQDLINPDQETDFERLEAIDINATIPQVGDRSTYESGVSNSNEINLSEVGPSAIELNSDPSEAKTINSLNPIAGLYAEAGPMRRFFFLITKSVSMVGRDPSNHCDLPPDGERADRQISRRHFELTLIDSDRWEVRCVSNQGMTLNQTVLSLGETATIKDNDLIILGESTLRFRCSTSWRMHQVKAHLKLLPPQGEYDFQ